MNIHEKYKEKLAELNEYSHCKKWELEETTDFYLDASAEQIKAHIKATALALIDVQIEWAEGEKKDIYYHTCSGEASGYNEPCEMCVPVVRYNQALQDTITNLKHQRELIEKEIIRNY